MLKQIQGGVCAAKGFTANGVHCGIRKNKTKRDLALIYSEVPASAAAVYTQNLVKGAPLTVACGCSNPSSPENTFPLLAMARSLCPWGAL